MSNLVAHQPSLGVVRKFDAGLHLPKGGLYCGTESGAAYINMRGKHRRTLVRIFTRPTPVDIRWSDIATLLQLAGVEVSSGSGSRMRLIKGSKVMIIHRPHPQSETGRATVRDIASFLSSIGVEP